MPDYPRPDHEDMVPVEGGQIYVRVNGNLAGGKPPIIALHGGPGSNHVNFLELLPLANERAVILYDQLDSGKSDWTLDPRNYRVERFVDEVDKVRQKLSVTHCHVIGSSWGGTIALEYGARRPPGLASLILSAPFVSTRQWLSDTTYRRAQLPRDVQAELVQCDSQPTSQTCADATHKFYDNFVRRTSISERMRKYNDTIMAGRTKNKKLYEAMWGPNEFTCTGSLNSYDGTPLLPRLNGIPTLFIGGQYDEALPRTLAGYAAKVSGGEHATIPGAGHSSIVDRTAEYLGVLAPWMSRHDA